VAIGAIWLFLTRRKVVTSQAVVPWRGPKLDPVPLVNGLAVRFRGMMQDRADVGHLNGSANGRPHALVDNGSMNEEFEEPDLLEQLEESYRDSLERLNRAECPELAARLLERLHQLRTTIRVLEGSADAAITDDADDETNHSILRAGS
jgi:hypothetical protein